MLPGHVHSQVFCFDRSSARLTVLIALFTATSSASYAHPSDGWQPERRVPRCRSPDFRQFRALLVAKLSRRHVTMNIDVINLAMYPLRAA